MKTVAHGAYFPGAVTAIAFVAVGARLFVAVVRQLRTQSVPADQARASAPVAPALTGPPARQPRGPRRVFSNALGCEVRWGVFRPAIGRE